MKNMSKEQLILIKKGIGAGCALLCLLLMLFNVFTYTSSTSVLSGGDVTWDDGVSLYTMLFNGDSIVVYDKVSYIREILVFSQVVMWISFIGMVGSFCVGAYGVFTKKNLFSKIASISLISSIGILLLINFDVEKIANTSKYLSVLTPFYFICLLVAGLGLLSTLTIKDK